MSRVEIRRYSYAAISMAALIALAHPGEAVGQYFMSYAGGTASRGIRATITVATEAEQAIDTNHQTIARWLLASARSMLSDVYGSVPDSEVRRRLSDARAFLEKKDSKNSVRSVTRAGEELRNLATVWNVAGTETKMAELSALVEKGDIKAAIPAAQSLADLVRVDPLRRCLDRAGAQLDLAREKQSKGYEMEALGAIGEAKHWLRKAYLASRLTQAKIILAHARLMLRDGKRCRAGWALWRGSRKIKKGSYLVDEVEADAITKIAVGIEEARASVSGEPTEALNKVAEVEAKVAALLDILCPHPGSAA